MNTAARARETQRVRRMMKSPRMGTVIHGPEGCLHGFLDDVDREEDVEVGRRLDNVRRLQVCTDDLGTVTKGTILTIDDVEWRVWDRPRKIDDGVVSILYLVPVQ